KPRTFPKTNRRKYTVRNVCSSGGSSGGTPQVARTTMVKTYGGISPKNRPKMAADVMIFCCIPSGAIDSLMSFLLALGERRPNAEIETPIRKNSHRPGTSSSPDRRDG